MNNIIVIYEDDDLMVVNKPVGILVHADGHNNQGTVVDWLLSREPSVYGVGEIGYSPQGVLLERSGVVHRLDKDTSGVLVLAKTQTAFVHLKAQFHDRKAKKEYRALVYGAMKETEGVIDRPIGRSSQDGRKRSAMRGAVGTLREAVTEWERLSVGQYKGEAFSYLKLLPKTGRTHQLRVHLRALERPIVGDRLYASHIINKSNNLELSRLALHAYSLTIALPNNNPETFTASVPTELTEAVSRIAED